jgi:hypothetical protein
VEIVPIYLPNPEFVERFAERLDIIFCVLEVFPIYVAVVDIPTTDLWGSLNDAYCPKILGALTFRFVVAGPALVERYLSRLDKTGAEIDIIIDTHQAFVLNFSRFRKNLLTCQVDSLS